MSGTGSRTMVSVTLQVSVVMPAYDEAPNVVEVVPATVAALQELGLSHEILVIDDGSSDDTRSIMSGLQAAHPTVRYVRLRRNLGKSAALSVGFDQAQGDTVVLMDADGQDDPGEIRKLLAALDEGLDLVTGSRVGHRRDRFVKRHTSRLYNRATTLVTGVAGRDLNSGFKAMRRPVAETLDMHGELHRYIPVLAAWAGFEVGEVSVEHHHRLHGRSKFGRARFYRGVLDLVTVKFLTTYVRRPFHLFGGVGLVLGLVGGGLLTWLGIEKILGYAIGDRPALIVGVLLVVVAFQLMSLGLIGELLIQHNRAASPADFAQERYADGPEEARPEGLPALLPPLASGRHEPVLRPPPTAGEPTPT